MRVSIVIPTCDRPNLLARLLESIRQQSHQDFEVVIVNDASSDIEAYDKVISSMNFDQDVRHVLLPRKSGAPACRNRGIRMSNFDFIALVDDDDEWLPEKLARQVECARQNPQLGLIYTWADGVGEGGKSAYQYRSTLRGDLRKEILERCFIPSPSVMVSRRAIIESGLFDESFPSCQDWDMWTRIIHNRFEVDVVQEVLCLHHQHGGTSIGKSTRARLGYALYHRKHLSKFVRYGMAKSVAKYVLRRFGSY